MPASTRSGPSIIVGGPGVATAMSAADRVDYQLILSLGAVSGNVSRLATLEAKAILRTEGGQCWVEQSPAWVVSVVAEADEVRRTRVLVQEQQGDTRCAESRHV